MQGPEKQKKQQTSQCVSFINPTDELMNSQNPSARGKRRLAATTQPSKSVYTYQYLHLYYTHMDFQHHTKKWTQKNARKQKTCKFYLNKHHLHHSYAHSQIIIAMTKFGAKI